MPARRRARRGGGDHLEARSRQGQAQFNAWAEETGLPYVQLSRICAMSIGENYSVERLASYAGDEE